MGPKVGTFSDPKIGVAWRPLIRARVFHYFYNFPEAFAMLQGWDYCSGQTLADDGLDYQP